MNIQLDLKHAALIIQYIERMDSDAIVARIRQGVRNTPLEERMRVQDECEKRRAKG